jgi:CRP/FNR family transcriptional regulator
VWLNTFKVSTIHDEGRELLLYYVKERESCAITLNFCRLAQTSRIKDVAEKDSVQLFVPVRLIDQWMMKYPSWIVGSSVLNHTHQQIGDELGTNRVVISQVLKKLEEDKKRLLYNKQIKLLKDL